MTTNHQTGYPALLRSLRRSARDLMSGLLARYFGTREPVLVPLAMPDTILVCRLNKRIGNILFLTPFLQSLALNFPDAKIDVLIQEAGHECLLEGLPGVRDVHSLPRSLRDIVGLICRIRRNRYDLVIDPITHSQSNRAAMAISNGKQRLGFTGTDQWLRLSHAVSPDRFIEHEGLKPLSLLHGALLGHSPKLINQLRTVASPATTETATREMARQLDSTGNNDDNSPVVGFFTEATGAKQLSAQWWAQWQACMARNAPEIRLVRLMPLRTTSESQTGDTPNFFADNLEVLAAMLCQLECFVSADCGPMHLATAAGIPVVGVFSKTKAENYGPLGNACIALRSDAGPEAVAEQTIARVTGGTICNARIKQENLRIQDQSVNPGCLE